MKRHLGLCDPKDIFIITGENYFHNVLAQAKEVHPLLADQILLEPSPQNTAPAIALALKFLKEKKESLQDEVLFISPADHIITPETLFWEQIKKAEALAKEKECIVTFGVRPTRPETGYGYIKASSDLVERFVEKPDKKTAQTYVLSGDYFWNSGMFAFTLGCMEKEISLHAPEINASLQLSYEHFLSTFNQLPSISIDYAVLEKSAQVRMLPLELTWSDVGCWDNVYELLEKDDHSNVTVGQVVTVDTKNSLIFADKRMVATIGVEDLLVVETDDALLISKKEESQKVKDIVGLLKERGSKEIHEHLTTQRPWGYYTVLEEGKRYKIKKILVNPLEKLSLQLHYHRSEHWVIVRGTAKVTISETQTIVHEGESIFVPKSALHRVENPGKVPLEIIEVQVGEYLGEDDIVRFEDVYGRLKEEEAFQVLLSRSKDG